MFGRLEGKTPKLSHFGKSDAETDENNRDNQRFKSCVSQSSKDNISVLRWKRPFDT